MWSISSKCSIKLDFQVSFHFLFLSLFLPVFSYLYVFTTFSTLNIYYFKKLIWEKNLKVILLNFKVRSFWGLDAGIRGKETRSLVMTLGPARNNICIGLITWKILLSFFSFFFRLHLRNKSQMQNKIQMLQKIQLYQYKGKRVADRRSEVKV